MAIKMKTVVTQRATADGVSHSRTDVNISGHTVVVDEPEIRGGTNMGAAPTEMALAALISCTNVIGNKCAHHLGIDLGKTRLEAACQFDRRGVTLSEEVDLPFKEITIDVYAGGSATQDELNRVGEETEKFCAVAKLYRAAGTNLQVNWHKA